ncbi:MAG: sugar phosphate nucleotidyltransferase [bacterium]
MQAVIFAAGEGTRLRPLTHNKPKPMLEVSGRPILKYSLDSLPDCIDEVIIVVGFLSDQIRDYFGEAYKKMKIRYALQREQRGTFDALNSARPYIRNDPFLCMMGDDFYNHKDLIRLAKHDLAMLVIEKDDPGRFSVCLEKNGYLLDIINNPEITSHRNLIFTGACVLTKDIFEEEIIYNNQNEQSLPHTMVSLSKKHPVRMIRAGFWLSITYPDDLLTAERTLIMDRE